MAKFIPDGAVELYWDNTKHFETNAGGVKVNDSLYMGFGNSNDLQISHNATDSTILNQTGNLRVRTTGDLYLQVNGGSNENAIVAKTNSSVDIYYDNNKKFNTDPDGVQVTGILQAHLNISDSDFTAHDWHVLQSNDNGKAAVIVEHSGDNNAYGLIIAFTDDNPDNNTNYFINCYDTTNTRFRVYSDGDVVNHDNSYGSTSDVKLKENIVDAGSQWDDIKAVKVRNFNFKTDTPSDKRLGVIAQELETVSPGLVSDDPDLDKNNNNLGTTTKSVKYSILYMKAIKALQEAMAKIETLETKVAALESA